MHLRTRKSTVDMKGSPSGPVPPEAGTTAVRRKSLRSSSVSSLADQANNNNNNKEGIKSGSEKVKPDTGDVKVKPEPQEEPQVLQPLPKDTSPPPPPPPETISSIPELQIKEERGIQDQQQPNSSASSYSSEAPEPSEEHHPQERPPNTATRRIFTTEFKLQVIEAFNTDPECIGNQRATARKFGIHRRQVQKWIQQLSEPQRQSNEEPSQDPQDQSHHREMGEHFLASLSTGGGGGGEGPSALELLSEAAASFSSGKIIRGCGEEWNKTLQEKSEKDGSELKMPGKGTPTASNRDSSKNSSPSDPDRDQTSTPSILMALNLHRLPPQSQRQQQHSSSTSPFHENHPLRNSQRTPPPTVKSSILSSPPNHFGGNGFFHGGSPQGQNSRSSSRNSTSHLPIDLVDELCYIYPNADFSLLRKALLKNEISLFKLQQPPPQEHSTNNSRKNPPSPTPSSSFALEILKKQSEYVQFLQQSGLSLPAFFSGAAAAAGGNGNGNFSSGDFFPGLKPPAPQQQQQHHNFTSPKPPTSNGGGGKAKTVAAVLAATRNQKGDGRRNGGSPYGGGGGGGGRKRGPKGGNQRTNHTNNSTITKPPTHEDHENQFDPTSMLELVSSMTSPSNSTSYGVDLTNSKSRPLPATNGGISFEALERFFKGAATGNGGLEHSDSPPLPQGARRTSPTSSTTSSGCGGEASETERSRSMVLEAFTYDPEVAGDARGVARKFGLNIRVVMKWLREGPSKNVSNNGMESSSSSLLLNNNIITNGGGGNNKSNSSSKRKNPNPNQICDFTTGNDGIEEDDNAPIDMVVPIKKRRLSTPTQI